MGEQLLLSAGASSASLGLEASPGRAGRSGSTCRFALAKALSQGHTVLRETPEIWLSTLLPPPLAQAGENAETLTSWLSFVPEGSRGPQTQRAEGPGLRGPAPKG